MTFNSCEIFAEPSTAARSAYQAALVMAVVDGTVRTRALQAMAKALREAQNDILEANTLDLEATLQTLQLSPDLPALAPPPLTWLKLTPERLQVAIACLLRLSEMPDPIRRVTSIAFQAQDSHSYCQLMPLGALALVHESLPELGAIVAGMCIKTGNSLVLHHSPEAHHTTQAIARALQVGLSNVPLPSGCLNFLESSTPETCQDLIQQTSYLNAILAHGRPQFVQAIAAHSSLPTIRSVTGNCYLYWSASGNLDMVRSIILDSYRGSPDQVNAIDKVLVAADRKPTSISTLWNSLREEGFTIQADANLTAEFPEIATISADWHTPCPERTILFKTIDSLELAMLWIDQHSSGHANCLVTESYSESCQFVRGLGSASVFVNASPRFTRLQGNIVYLGMSNQPGMQRGFIGLEALTRLKYIVQGG